MALLVSLEHRTEYRYDTAVFLGPQVIQLRPAPHCRTPIVSYGLTVTPQDRVLRWQFDALGNQGARAIFPTQTTEFSVAVELTADLTPYNPFDFFVEPAAESWPFRYGQELTGVLAPYRALELGGRLLREFVEGVKPAGREGSVGLITRVNAAVCNEIGYTTRMEHGVQECEATLELGTGSCRDSGWLLVQVLRQLGFAARFVSGYLIQLKNGMPDGPKKDSADLHAWAEVYLPGAGWIGLDPTSGLLTAEGHLPLAATPSPSEAAPIAGTVGPAKVSFSYSMVVRRVGAAVEAVSGDGLTAAETTVEEPYSEREWAAVRTFAHRLDEDLAAQDVRLTMGGEPTFVGIDEPESLQWSVEAMGALKRTRGLELIRDLRERTAPGGLLHFGQGKWYPGEPLPRWAFHCISRMDGVAVWEDASLIATETAEYGYGVGDALKFATALADRLEVRREDVLGGWDPVEDADLAASEPAGYLMPLRRRSVAGTLRWSSQPWFERPERVVLSFGDSPMGYRIPVSVMPFVAPDEIEREGEALPSHPARRPELFGVEAAVDPLPPLSATAETAKELVRPALCVQAREGRLCVFLPYVAALPDYLDLVAAVEDACVHLGVRIWVEGYPPPYDVRMRLFSLTPDPGVLEVNLPPTKDWDDLEALNKELAEAAAGNRLIAGKFGFDGSHLATGGGSHITLGAPSVLESPVLRRPDLLKSMLAFWQNHPSLSYLFSGMYVGPTSQYPRVDEARADALYELEVSFSQLRETDPPYIVDGLFRNLLVDVTGNTHRAEFCIDKMYPPEGQGLRAGLLELRAFEMAPHYRMGLTQMLLVRALVGMFWRTPFTGELVRWETALHDRFMLPHFVEQDFRAVLDALRASGYAVKDEWFAAQVQFRFPKIGAMVADRFVMELRQALEPWNVLAEETNSGRTGRSVDSSLERIQIKVNGLDSDGRYVVACSGRQVPLVATGRVGEYVAGIRFRARMLSAALHPTVPVHTPLVFDVIDTVSGRSVGRCTYFSHPPDGSVHATRPKDPSEARARRLERFVISEPPAEPVGVPEPESNAVFPMTLDLRWPAPGGEMASR